MVMLGSMMDWLVSRKEMLGSRKEMLENKKEMLGSNHRNLEKCIQEKWIGIHN